jgi:hypothetical protein
VVVNDQDVGRRRRANSAANTARAGSASAPQCTATASGGSYGANNSAGDDAPVRALSAVLRFAARSRFVETVDGCSLAIENRP